MENNQAISASGLATRVLWKFGESSVPPQEYAQTGQLMTSIKIDETLWLGYLYNHGKENVLDFLRSGLQFDTLETPLICASDGVGWHSG